MAQARASRPGRPTAQPAPARRERGQLQERSGEHGALQGPAAAHSGNGVLSMLQRAPCPARRPCHAVHAGVHELAAQGGLVEEPGDGARAA